MGRIMKRRERENMCVYERVCVCCEKEREREMCEASSRVNGSTKNLQQKS